MSDDPSETNDQAGRERSTSPKWKDSAWSLMGSTTLEGKLGIIICWYFDGAFEGVKSDRHTVRRLLQSVRWYLTGQAERLNYDDLFRLFDALASYPKEDQELSRVAT